MSDDDLDSGWRFGPYELRPLGHLTRGSRIVPLTAIERHLLMLLLEHAGEIVPREVFLQSAWPGRAVDDANLTTNFYRLRRQLGDTVIRTVHGVGYVLGCDAEPLATTEEAHATYLTRLFLRATDERQRMRDVDWDQLYLPRIDEVRSALDWALAKPGRKHLAIGLAGATARLWERLSLLPEGRRYLDRAEQLIDDDTRPAAAARVLYQRGLLWREADRPRSLAYCQRAEAIYRKLNDKRNLGDVLGVIGDAYLFLGQHEKARAALKESEKLLSVSDQSKALWNVLNGLGLLASMNGMPKEAMHYFSLARDLARMLEDSLREYIIVLNMGELEFAEGALDRAIERAREAARGLESAPTTYRVRPMVNLATYEALQGNLPKARQHVEEVLPLLADQGGYWLRLCLLVSAFLAAGDGRYVDAARLRGFIEQQFVLFGEARQKPEQLLSERLRQKLGEGLTPDSIGVWGGEGADWREDQAVKYTANYLIESRKTRAG
ncbi:MAG TPA: winged helix-turn-helix domain-containing protein [Aliidongia sp.]|nr:winged helix-turn-helix domain-containing protein [Aliidongia sp.]